MTISSEDRVAGPFIGNDVTVAFPFTFKVFTATDVRVVQTDVDLDQESDLVLNTDYTVSLNANQNTNPGGTVTLTSALASGQNLTITSSLSYLQPTDLTNQGGFYPSVITNALDRLTIFVQQLADGLSRSIKLPLSTIGTVSTTLPSPESNSMIGWNASGNALQNVSASTLATVVAYGTAKADTFTGDGVTTQFTLTDNPGAQANLDVSIGGATQTPGDDYTWLGGTTVTFTSPPPNGVTVLVRYMQGLPFGTVDADNVVFQPPGTGGATRMLSDRLEDQIFAGDYGVAGDYSTDDTSAFESACAAAVALNKTLDISGLNIRLTHSVDLPEGIRIRADGHHNVNHWFDTADKTRLRPGFKHLVTGGNIWLSGTANKTYTTNRVDGYSSFTYGLSYLHLEPPTLSGIGIILDCDVYTAGGVATTGANDNAANYDVGLLMRSYQTNMTDVAFFGYWNKCGFVLHSQQDLETIDSDYVNAMRCQFSGIAVIGDETGNNGLTGFTGLGCRYYSAADHHDVASGNYTIPAIFVDGPVSGVEGIRGHRFDGSLRTRSNDAVSIDRCRDIRLDLYVSETPIAVGVPGADAQGKIVGTSNTGNVYIGFGAWSSTTGLGIDDLAATISGTLIAIGGQDKSHIMVSVGGKVTRIMGNGSGDSVIQLTSDPSSYTSGWTILRDDSASDTLSYRYANTEVASLTAAGVFEVDASVYSGAGNFQAIGASTEAILRSGGETANARIRTGATTRVLISPDYSTFTNNIAVRPSNDNTISSGIAANRWSDTFSVQFRPGDGTPIWTSGTGSPAGVLSAPVGSMYTRLDGGAGTTLYVKESGGTGNTGWVAK